MKKIIFINSHPIQYFAPLYKYMNEQGIETAAWYCSDASVKGGRDAGFGVNVKWDIPLLAGYESVFFKNRSWKPSHTNGFLGLINISMIKRVFTIPKSVIVVHGWNYFTHLFIIMLGRLKGHTICLRCEMPLNQEVLKTGFKQVVKRLGLKYIVFPRINNFLYIGSQNRAFYKSYGVGEERLLFCPYSVDNARFTDEWQLLNNRKANIKQTLGIPEGDKIILYSGKYIDKKRPLDILQAFIQLNKPGCWLVMVGDGALRPNMEALIKQHSVSNVILTGFVNQSLIPAYYAVSDVFVMCSEVGETWGLSVNEAMNFNLPVIVSSLTGCANDLVKDGVNGYVFETGNVNDLADKLEQVLYQKKLSHSVSSKHIVNNYSYSVISGNIKSFLSSQ
jgi:glycosyltransferase involved in cell wall biosynthesis